MFKQTSDILKQLKELYPQLTNEQLEDIVKSQFKYIKEEIESERFNHIKTPYLGKFWVGVKGNKIKKKIEMFKKAQEIFEGWKNNLFRNDPEIEKEAKRRLDICQQCKLIKQGKDFIQPTTLQKLTPDSFFCSQENSEYSQVTQKREYGCACPLDQKARSTDSECPLGKWIKEQKDDKGI